jgi:glycosyltransferase involved in cell wall biosynthesis
MKRWIAFFALLLVCVQVEGTNTRFVIVSPSYNNEKWCERSLESIACQTYQNWSLVYINDCSTDNTGALVENFINTHNLSKKSVIISNKERVGAMANFHKVISKLPEDVVVVHVDGDDRLAHPYVLARLADVYADKRVWMTYGNYQTEPGGKLGICVPFPKEVLKNASFRTYPWTSSHLKTYYAKLFQQIHESDFMCGGTYFQVASDVAFMLPMLEMASQGHIKHLPDVLYLYNTENALSDVRNFAQFVDLTDRDIRSRKKYPSLDHLFQN